MVDKYHHIFYTVLTDFNYTIDNNDLDNVINIKKFNENIYVFFVIFKYFFEIYL